MSAEFQRHYGVPAKRGTKVRPIDGATSARLFVILDLAVGYVDANELGGHTRRRFAPSGLFYYIRGRTYRTTRR